MQITETLARSPLRARVCVLRLDQACTRRADLYTDDLNAASRLLRRRVPSVVRR